VGEIALGAPRPDYVALVDELDALAQGFGCSLSDDARAAVSRMTLAVEVIDRHVDGEREEAARQGTWDAVLGAFEDRAPEGVDRELARAAIELAAVARSRGVSDRVRRIMKKEFQTAEAMRVARSAGAYARLASREGRLFAALALAMCGKGFADARFRRFFARLAAPANALDKLVDLRRDRAAGEVRVEPSFAAHARLAFAVLRAVPALLVAHPRPLSVLTLGVTWLVRLRRA
jgi:hypothetical protein